MPAIAFFYHQWGTIQTVQEIPDPRPKKVAMVGGLLLDGRITLMESRMKSLMILANKPPTGEVIAPLGMVAHNEVYLYCKHYGLNLQRGVQFDVMVQEWFTWFAATSPPPSPPPSPSPSPHLRHCSQGAFQAHTKNWQDCRGCEGVPAQGKPAHNLRRATT